MKISDLFKTIEVKIPDTDIVIKVKEEMSWFEQIKYAGMDDSVERGKFLLACLIEEWNLEGEDGKKLLPTAEIIGRLPANIVLPIMEAASKKTEEKDVKKKT